MVNATMRAATVAVTVLACALATTARPALVDVVEFVSPTQFLTASSVEARALDASRAGRHWSRTSMAFKADDVPEADTAAVCRFFSTRNDVGAHFYTAFAEECDALKRSPDWAFEGIAFHVPMPDVHGNCPANTTPVYRLHRPDTAGVFLTDFQSPFVPHHLLTPSLDYRRIGLDSGWVPEGVGALGVAFCTRSFANVAQQRLQRFAENGWEFELSEAYAGTYGVSRLTLRTFASDVRANPPATSASHGATLQDAPFIARVNGSYFLDGYPNPLLGSAVWSPRAGRISMMLDRPFALLVLDLVDADTVSGCVHVGGGASWDYDFEATDYFIGPCESITGRRVP
jgi:hypothetical protein